MRTQIGNFEVNVVKRLHNLPFGGNARVLIEVNGKQVVALRQGCGLGFWAFEQRPRLTPAEQKRLDTYIDDIFYK